MSSSNQGWLKRKAFLGIWCDRFCQLLGTQLIVSKDEKRESVDCTLEITPMTKIEIITEDRTKPRFLVQPANVKTETVFEANSFDEMMKWVLLLRGLTFTNPDISMDSFETISIIGRGYYGKVRLVKAKETGELFAIKSIKKSKLLAQNKVHTVLSERNILAKASHPFIVSLKFAFQTNSKFYLGLEYVPGGELFNHIQKDGHLPRNEYRLILAEVAIALDYMHSIGVIYRDIKPENILIGSDGYIKLTDFGLAKDVTVDELTSTFCGTPEYVAPEMVKGYQYDQMVDWWALGILAYELIYHRTPFRVHGGPDGAENKAKIYSKIAQKETRFPPDADPVDVSFISGLLEKDPKKRFCYSDVKNHQFFTGLDFDDVLAKRIVPEYVPSLDSETNTKYFDSQFTSECKAESFGAPMMGDFASVPGFSYTDSNFINSNYDENNESIIAEDVNFS